MDSITTTDMILVYLADYRSYGNEMDAPMALTQIGIAEAVGIARSNVRRSIEPLLDREFVETHKAHVPGIKLKRNVYYLTGAGTREAISLSGKIAKYPLTVIQLDGDKTLTTLGEAGKHIPFDVRIVDIIRESKKGIFDCQLFKRRGAEAERRVLGPQEVAEPRHFVGRAKELGLIEEWLGSPGKHTLVVKGMPGVGKSALVAKAVAELSTKHTICYFRIQPWCSMRSLLQELARNLSECGIGELAGYLSASEAIDLSEVEYLLTKGLKDAQFFFVFDDFHNVNQNVLTFFSMFQAVNLALANIKIIAVGRAVEQFYDIRDARIHGNVLILSLTGLDAASSKELGRKVGIAEEAISGIYGQTNGNPLFIELLGSGGTVQSADLERFIMDEFSNHLDREGLDLLKHMSVFRFPVLRSAFRYSQPALANLIGQSIIAQLTDDYVQPQNLVRDCIYRQLSHDELVNYHSKAAEHYLESSDTGSLIEALHHLILSGQEKSAVDIILEREDGLLKSDKTNELVRILAVALSKCKDISKQDKARLIYMQGASSSYVGEWDDAIAHFEQAGKISGGKDSEKIRVKCELGLAKILLKRNEYEKSEALLENALKWANSHGENRLAAEVNYQLGSVHERLGDVEKALKHFKTAQRISTVENDKYQLANAYYGLGRIQHRNRKYEKALESKKKALDIATKLGDEKTAAKMLTSIGGTYDKLGCLDEEIKVHEQAIEMARRIGAARALGYALSNAGSAYMDKPDYIKSSQYLDEAAEIFEKLGERRMVASVELNMAINHLFREKREEALKLIQECIHILEMLKDKNRLLTVYLKFGCAMKKVEGPKSSQKYLKKALQLSKELGDKKIIEEIKKELTED